MRGGLARTCMSSAAAPGDLAHSEAPAVYVHASMCAWTWSCVLVCACKHVCLYLVVCAYVCMQACVLVPDRVCLDLILCVLVCACKHVCLYLIMCVCTWLCVCLYVHASMCACTCVQACLLECATKRVFFHLLPVHMMPWTCVFQLFETVWSSVHTACTAWMPLLLIACYVMCWNVPSPNSCVAAHTVCYATRFMSSCIVPHTIWHAICTFLCCGAHAVPGGQQGGEDAWGQGVSGDARGAWWISTLRTWASALPSSNSCPCWFPAHACVPSFAAPASALRAHGWNNMQVLAHMRANAGAFTY